MFHGFLNNPEVFFAEEKENLKRDWVWRWELKKKYLVWFSNGREGEEKKEKEEEWLGFETGLHFWFECEIETELSTRTTGRLLDHTSIYRGRGSNDHIHIKILYLTLRALTVYFSNLRNSNFQGFMTFVFVCGLLWTGLSMSFLKICLLCRTLLIFANILDYETVERDHFFRAYCTL